MGLIGVLATLFLLTVAPSIAGASWSTSFGAPYQGHEYAGWNASIGGSYSFSYAQPTYFNMTSGVGGFNASLTLNSTNLPVAMGGGYGAADRLSPTIFAEILVPFNNRSGTRTLRSVQVNASYRGSGSLLLTEGSCPWIKASHSKSRCAESTYIDGGPSFYYMSYLKGGHATYPTCTGCGAVGASDSISMVNRSTGLNVSGSPTNGTIHFSGSGNATVYYVPIHPLKASGTLVIRVLTICYIEAMFGAGSSNGLVGAQSRGQLTFSMTVNSIVEY